LTLKILFGGLHAVAVGLDSEHYKAYFTYLTD
jgi:hypothetical protein